MVLSAALQERLDGLAALALDKQLALGDLLGDDHDWTFDLQAGVIEFSGGALGPRTLSFPGQVLGTESHGSGTWQWAWANRQSNIPASHTMLCRKLRDYGERELVPELVKPTLALADVSGHALAMVSSGLTAARFYYRGPYEGGAVYLLVKEPSYQPSQANPPVRIPRVVTELLHGADLPVVDHERTVIDYLTYYGATVARRDDPGGAAILGTLAAGQILATFDGRHRLLTIEAHPGAASG